MFASYTTQVVRWHSSRPKLGTVGGRGRTEFFHPLVYIQWLSYSSTLSPADEPLFLQQWAASATSAASGPPLRPRGRYLGALPPGAPAAAGLGDAVGRRYLEASPLQQYAADVVVIRWQDVLGGLWAEEILSVRSQVRLQVRSHG